jgi:hypothetical protein
MGLLNQIFGKQEKEEILPGVRAWALQQEKRHKNNRQVSFDLIFDAVILSVSHFGEFLKNTFEHDDVPPNREKFRNKPFAGDSSLFEIACYSFSLIDYWFLNNRNESRNNFCGRFYSELITLFADFLDEEKSYIKDLINERYSKYSEMLKNDEDIKAFHVLLVELLMRTKYNSPLKRAVFDDFETLETGFFCDYPAMIIAISSFEKNMIPAMIESIENFLRMVE